MTNSDLQKLIAIFLHEIEGIRIENLLILLIAEALIVLFIGKVLLKKKNISDKKLLFTYLFLVYVDILLTLTIFRRPEGSREGIVHLFIQLGLGLKTGRPSAVHLVYTMLNLMLFVPYGVLIYMFFKNRKILFGILMATILGSCTSWIIECTQFITGRGMFELTDILTNTVGSFVGALLAVFVCVIHRKLSRS